MPLNTSIKRRLLLAASASVFSTPFIASAQSFPNRPIRIIVPYPPGGAVDVFARTLSQYMSSVLRQALVIDNRAGAGGALGADFVSKAAPDGYTLLFSNLIPLAITPHLTQQAAPINSFSPISAFAYVPQVLASSRHNVFSALSGHEVMFGNAGIGSLSHITAVMVARSANLRVNHIPYKGYPPMLHDMMANNLDVAISSEAVLGPLRASGKLNYLAVTSPMPSQPNVPNFDQLGISDATLTDWYGLLAPAGTPTAIISQLNNALIQVVNSAEVQQRIKSFGALPQLSSPEQFGLLIRLYSERVGKAVRENGIKL